MAFVILPVFTIVLGVFKRACEHGAETDSCVIPGFINNA